MSNINLQKSKEKKKKLGYEFSGKKEIISLKFILIR